MKTLGELEQLKRDWAADPCWDLEDTEGFEEHRKELKAYRLECEYYRHLYYALIDLNTQIADKKREILRLEKMVNVLTKSKYRGGK